MKKENLLLKIKLKKKIERKISDAYFLKSNLDTNRSGYKLRVHQKFRIALVRKTPRRPNSNRDSFCLFDRNPSMGPQNRP